MNLLKKIFNFLGIIIGILLANVVSIIGIFIFLLTRKQVKAGISEFWRQIRNNM